MDFVELEQPADETVHTSQVAAPATRQAEPAPLLEGEASQPAPQDAKPSQAQAAGSEPPARPRAPVLRLRPVGRIEEIEDTEARTLAPAAPTLRISQAPAPPAWPPAALPAAPAGEPPVLESGGHREAAADGKTRPRPSRTTRTSVELRALLQRLTHDVEEVSARLRGSAGLTMTPRQQMGFGFRAFFGFLLGAGLFALAGMGILGLAGLLFYPPALALPQAPPLRPHRDAVAFHPAQGFRWPRRKPILHIQSSILNVQLKIKGPPGGVRFTELAVLFTWALRIEDWILSIGLKDFAARVPGARAGSSARNPRPTRA